MKKKKIFFVIPAYHEEKNIPLVFRELQKNIFEKNENYEYFLLFINDGSKDASWKEIKKICRKYKNVGGIELSRNFGHQAALSAGFDYAKKADAVITMDADLQDPVEICVQMIEEWGKGAEVVYARRIGRRDNFLKKYTAILYYKILSIISDTEIPRNVGDFRLIDKKVLQAFLIFSERDRYIRGMFAWLGFKTSFVDFERPERQNGKSGYSWKKMIRLAMDGVLNFSLFPLRLGFIIGGLMIGVSWIFLLYMIGDSFIFDTIYPLYKWLSVLGFGFMGLQFIFIWIVGEYIGRIYNETRQRPVYIISEMLNIKPEGTRKK